MLMRGASELVRLHQEIDGGDHVIEVSGEIDVYTSPLLASALNEASDASRIILDLTDCRYVDASALSLFVKTHRRSRGRLVLIVPGGLVRKALSITGLDRQIPVVASRHLVEERVLSRGCASG